MSVKKQNKTKYSNSSIDEHGQTQVKFWRDDPENCKSWEHLIFLNVNILKLSCNPSITKTQSINAAAHIQLNVDYKFSLVFSLQKRREGEQEEGFQCRVTNFKYKSGTTSECKHYPLLLLLL